MKGLYRLMTVLVIALLLIAALPVVAQEEEGPPQVGLRPDAPPYALHGPYWVGTMEFAIEDEERPLPLTVWYPALNREKSPEEISCSFDYPPHFTGLIIEGHAIQDAEPDAENGPYPLVVFSHGLWMYRLQSTYFAEHLASHGFVIIAFDHAGETVSNNGEAFWSGYVLRPLDVQRVINYADTLTAGDGALAGLIDTDRIAVTGHSSGGFTSLLAGGVQLDLRAFAAWCEQYAETNPVSGCDQILPNQDEMATLAGLDAAPDGLWPPMNDARVDAIVTLSPDTNIFSQESLERASIPTMLMVGSSDSLLPPEINAFPLYASLGSPQKAMVVFEGGDHFVFVDGCERMRWMPDFGLFFLCSDSVWDMDRAHDLINHFTTAFLLSVLKGDAEASAALAPEAVQFPGITYETTMGQ